MSHHPASAAPAAQSVFWLHDNSLLPRGRGGLWKPPFTQFLSGLTPLSPLWFLFLAGIVFNAHGDGHCLLYCVNYALHVNGRGKEMMEPAAMRRVIAAYQFNAKHVDFYGDIRWDPMCRADIEGSKYLGLSQLHAAAYCYGLDLYIYDTAHPTIAPKRVWDMVIEGQVLPKPRRPCSGHPILVVCDGVHYGIADACACGAFAGWKSGANLYRPCSQN